MGLSIPEEPQISAAFGAALMARERAKVTQFQRRNYEQK
jgi:activator of 2-hydroxyglutaryl-CoA dehydratase